MKKLGLVLVVLCGLSGGLVFGADFNGDGTNDIGIFRPTSGMWAVRNLTRVYFGGSNDEAMPGDYNGDGTADFGLFRSNSGLWAVRGITRVYFGGSTDEPLPGIGGGKSHWGKSGGNVYYTAGNVGVGTSAPAYPLHIKGTGAGASWLLGIHNSGYSLNDNGLVVRADAGDPFWVQISGGTSALRVDNEGEVGIGINDPTYTLHVIGTAYCTTSWQSSDRRWKDNIETIPDPIEKVLKLRGVKFDWKREEFKENRFPEGRQIGLIAQEVEKEFPECVNTALDGYKAIAYDRFSAVLLEAVKSQQKTIEAQNTRLKLLEEKLAKLEGI